MPRTKRVPTHARMISMKSHLMTRTLTALCGIVVPLTCLAYAQPADTSREAVAQSAQDPTPLQPQVIEPLSWEDLSRFLGGPSLLTLHLSNATPQQVAAELSKQSPLPFSLLASN